MFNLAQQPQMRQSAPSTQATPQARSPLHNFKLHEQARVQDETCGVWMNELSLLGYIALRGQADDAEFTQAVHDALGITLPTTPHTFTVMKQGVAIWQSPDEWLLVCSRKIHATYLNNLTSALTTVHAQVVDNSGGLTMIYISGTHHTTLLRHLGAYDFDAITVGQAVGTFCQKVNIVALRADDKGLFVVFRRSFADYFWTLLTKSARPYTLGISLLKPQVGHPLLSLMTF